MNRVLGLLLILNFFVVLFGNAIAPLLSDYVLTIGGTVSDAGYAYAIMTWVAAATLIVSPKIKKHFQISDKAYLYVSFISQILVAIWYIFLQHIYEFYILQVLLSIFCPISIPVVFKWFQQFLTKEFAAQGWGLRKATLPAAGGLGAIISSHLVSGNNYQPVFYFLLGDAIFTFLLLLFVMEIYNKDFPKRRTILAKAK